MCFYTQQHQYYCGIDLPAKSMYLCILDQSGEIVLHQNTLVGTGLIKQLIKPFLFDMAIAVKFIFSWYWLADFCQKHHIPFVLVHALYMPLHLWWTNPL